MADTPTSTILEDGWPATRDEIDYVHDETLMKSVGVTVGDGGGGGATVVRTNPLLVRSDP